MKTQEYDKQSEQIIDMLTPKVEVKPSADLRQRILTAATKQRAEQKPRRKTPIYWLGAITSAAAVIAIAITLTLNTPVYAARKVVEQAIMHLAEADSYLIHFTARVTKSTSSHNLYEIVDPDDAPMQGTVEIRKEDSKVKMAIKWQDDERSMELYDGQAYRRYQNGQLVLERPDEGIDLSPLASLEKLKPYATAMGLLLKFHEEGDTIIVSDRSDKVEIVARFSKSEGRLLSAECTTPNNVTVLSIDQIEFDVPPTE